MSYSVGYRCGWDPALLWLWRRPAASVPIQPLDWEHPYAVGAALKSKSKKKKKDKTLGCRCGARMVYAWAEGKAPRGFLPLTRKPKCREAKADDGLNPSELPASFGVHHGKSSHHLELSRLKLGKITPVRKRWKERATENPFALAFKVVFSGWISLQIFL